MTIKAWVKYEEEKKNKGVFTIQPLDKGMGVTIGNSLRRVLLSSLDGHSMSAVKINGVNHEFSVLPDVVEDVLEIVCNLKGVIYKKDSNETKVVKLKTKGSGVVTASSIECSDGVEVVNKDHFLFEMTGKAEVDMEIRVTSGVGYVSVQHDEDGDDNPEWITTDSSYSPVIRVNHEVDCIRVGEELDHDLLNISVITNGIVKPDDAMKQAVSLLCDHYSIFNSINEQPQSEVDEEKSAEDARLQSVLSMSIDDLELSARSSNCLKRAGIETISELLDKDMSELIQIKNFGKKSADEINGKLKAFGLSLKEEQ